MNLFARRVQRSPRRFFAGGDRRLRVPSLIALAFVACLGGQLRGAPLEHDLGAGLTYFRVHGLPTDLPPAAAKAGPLVLDLRFAGTADSAESALDAWLRFRATATTPVIVLVNAATPESLCRVLSRFENAAGVLSVGGPAPNFTPDIVTKATLEEDRQAYDALEHGASLDSLITQNADKPRTDEASIMRARANPSGETDDSEFSDFEPADENTPPPPPPPKPVIDLTLQRAVQLHRALVALKRL